MSPLAWVTPDDAPGPAICRALYLPSGQAYEAAVKGALLPLIYESNWEQVGTQTPADVAAAFEAAIMQTISEWEPCPEGIVMYIGTVFSFAGDTPPAGCLLCNGEEYDVIDYPDLFAVIGDTYGGDGVDTFAVPDLRARVVLGVGPSDNEIDFYDLGEQGGEETHTLTESEMPAHTHTTHKHVNLTIATGSTNVQIAPTLATQASGSTGGDQAHNNMMPFTALTMCIRAE